jgi:hypothetical protein
MACGPTRWFGCSVDAVVSCGVNDGECDCLRGTVERRRVDVGFLSKGHGLACVPSTNLGV